MYIWLCGCKPQILLGAYRVLYRTSCWECIEVYGSTKILVPILWDAFLKLHMSVSHVLVVQQYNWAKSQYWEYEIGLQKHYFEQKCTTRIM